MRLLAALIALACCVLEGFRRKGALKRRAEFTGEISRMLSGFLIEIRCSGATLDELIRRADGRFAELARGYIAVGEDARGAWELACSQLPKNSGERALLDELGRDFGTSDREGTLRLVELYAERFSELEREAREAYSRKGRAVAQVGALCGIAAAIMII
ncbi:MAG: stage III sporulation protein AB [Lachnospiraceae bacterium]|nr:stage III sporulation protein AB [Ruminococcus sp.]MCM1273905.1 stage III sporulation protein AB [Lachnospiraceae bacterium]